MLGASTPSLAEVMSIAKADKKTTELGKLVLQLREHIDVHRIIGLNCDALRQSEFREALPGYMQRTAQESLAMHVCKMFERSDRNELNSIPGIIDAVQSTCLTPDQRVAFEKFGKRYGNSSDPKEAKAYLTGTFGLFCGVHFDSLNSMKKFRDQIGAHSDFKAAAKTLPSYSEIDSFFNFAKDFYELVAQELHQVEPDPIEAKVGRGLIRVMKTVGIDNVKIDFDED